MYLSGAESDAGKGVELDVDGEEDGETGGGGAGGKGSSTGGKVIQCVNCGCRGCASAD